MDIVDIISAGDNNDGRGGSWCGKWRRQWGVLFVRREDRNNIYDIGGGDGDGKDINDWEIEDENYDNHYNSNENEGDGDGEDEEGCGRSDE